MPHNSESALRKRSRQQALPEKYHLLALPAWSLYKQFSAMLELSACLPHVRLCWVPAVCCLSTCLTV